MAPKGFPWERQQEGITQASNIQDLKRMHLFTLLGFVLQNSELLEYSMLNGWTKVLIQFQAMQANSHFRKADFLLASALPSPFLPLVTHGQVERARQNQTAACSLHVSKVAPACSGSDPCPGCPTAPWVPLLYNSSHFCVNISALTSSLALFCKACLLQLSYFWLFCVPSPFSLICYPCFFHSLQ